MIFFEAITGLKVNIGKSVIVPVGGGREFGYFGWCIRLQCW